jgi:hypothetical protein
LRVHSMCAFDGRPRKLPIFTRYSQWAATKNCTDLG